MKKLLFILFLSFIGFISFGQTDTTPIIPQPDTSTILPKPIVKPVKKRIYADTSKSQNIPDTARRKDSLLHNGIVFGRIADTLRDSNVTSAKTLVPPVAVKKPFDTFYAKLLSNPFFKTTGKPIYLVVNERTSTSKDEMFYLLSALLLFLAFVKLVFSRYFQNMFRLFFQPAFRQKQTREQLLQNNLPSLLLNLFYVFSGATYISLLLSFYQIVSINFWLMLLYSASALLAVYFSKFIFLSFAGWVFNAKEATQPYIFTVYLINKILGVVLIPFSLIIAFSKPYIINFSITVSLLFVLMLFIYRYLISYSPVRKGLKVSVIHFLFYVFAFEITPLLLIYKTLIIYLDKSL